MRANVWWAAFVFAVIFHITVLAVVGQVILGEIALEPQKEYMEVELAAKPAAKVPAQPQAQAQAAPAAAIRQSNSINNNAAVPASAPAAKPVFAASEEKSVTPAAVADVSGGGTIAVTSGDSGAMAGTGVVENAEAGTGGSGSAPASAPPGSEDQEVDSQPYVVYSTLPEYPSEARKNRWQGKVVVRVLVEASGRVADASVAKSSGYNELDQAAEEVVYQWRFNPAYRDGRPVTVWVKLPVSFTLTM
ncbi:energy transducer TonB [Sporomusa ovata]|nr:energy transducer TonB [Sporomusa ovata]